MDCRLIRKASRLHRWIATLCVGVNCAVWRESMLSRSAAARRPKTTINDLPQEVLNYIITYLRGCDAALRACSLTCRAFMWQAQKELHRSIYVDWTRTVALSPDRYSSTRVARKVRSLHVFILPPPPFVDENWYSRDAELLWQIFRRFTCLQQLSISNTQWFCTARRRAVLLQTFATVTSLRLAATRFAHVSDFMFFLSGFANLEELRLDGVEWEDLTNPFNAWIVDLYPHQHVDLLPGRSLRRLSFGCWHSEFNPRVASEMIQHWLSRMSWRALEVEWHARESMGPLPELLRVIGQCITRLEIGRRRGRDGWEVAPTNPDLGIQYCTQLRSLVLHGSCARTFEFDPDWGLELYADGVFSWVPPLLGNVRSKSLTYIGLGCVLRNLHELDRFMNNLQVIDKLLQLQPFQGLQELSFSFETLPREYVPTAVDMVWKTMPYAAGRNLLTLYDRWDQL